MRWRNSKFFVIGVTSFITGCIFTLFLCSSSHSAPKNIESTELHRVNENAVYGTPPPQMTTVKPDIQSEVHDQPLTTTSAPKPTLSPYPPSLKDKAMFLSPSGYSEDAFLVIIVVSTGRNFEARKAIRTSWGKSTAESAQDSFQLFFVVGCDEVSDERVEKEAQKYGDILRGNFLDTYVQNELHTVKILLGLKWATSMCNPQYILKVNPESFVNVHETIKWLQSLSEASGLVLKHKEGLYSGYCHSGVKVVRNAQSPYFIPENQWSEDFLPVYGSGIGVVLSRDVAEKMVQIAREVIVLWQYCWSLYSVKSLETSRTPPPPPSLPPLPPARTHFVLW